MESMILHFEDDGGAIKYITNFYDYIREVGIADLKASDLLECICRSAVENHEMDVLTTVKELDMINWSANEQFAFWTLVRQFANRFSEPFVFNAEKNQAFAYSFNPEHLMDGMGKLVRKGVALSLPIEKLDETKDIARYVISPKIVEMMFRGKDKFISYEMLSNQCNVMLAKDIKPKKLFFSEDARDQFENFRRLISKDGFKQAKKRLEAKEHNPGLEFLLFGPPGTGKTEVVKQLAKDCGRDILMIDTAKTTQSAWGASEKAFTSLFLSYSYVAAVTDNVPILLLNEADSILSNRINGENSSCAKAENALSNIVLQAFETFKGIMFLTTNLNNNIDDAFDRRILFKVELTAPDESAREKIWRASIPELTESEAQSLARKYCMTGAQINNVVAKRELAELFYAGDRGYGFISSLCDKEMNGFDTKSTRKIGF